MTKHLFLILNGWKNFRDRSIELYDICFRVHMGETVTQQVFKDAVKTVQGQVPAHGKYISNHLCRSVILASRMMRLSESSNGGVRSAGIHLDCNLWGMNRMSNNERLSVSLVLCEFTMAGQEFSPRKFVEHMKKLRDERAAREDGTRRYTAL